MTGISCQSIGCWGCAVSGTGLAAVSGDGLAAGAADGASSGVLAGPASLGFAATGCVSLASEASGPACVGAGEDMKAWVGAAEAPAGAPDEVLLQAAINKMQKRIKQVLANLIDF